MYISRHNSPIHIDLLYFTQHYAWIKDFGRLFSDLTTYDKHTFFSKRCLVISNMKVHTSGTSNCAL